ncbi:AMP-binding protein [Paracoccaceae bacterium]|nr:AMP-binding protein [Paracoccaceae bacterium]
MDISEKIRRRVSELIEKYTDPLIYVPQLLCDQYPANKIAYTIINENMEEYDLSYGELKTQSTLIAHGLKQRGIKKGDRIATLMGKSKEYIITLLAIWRIGAVHVPLFTAFSTPAITLRVNGSNSKIIFCDQKQQSKLKPSDEFATNGKLEIITTANFEQTPNWASRWEDLLATGNSVKEEASLDPEAPIIHIFTSGTTGKPKGVILPVKALSCIEAYAEFAYDLRQTDIFWNAADPGWAYGLYCGILVTLTTGTPAILYEGGFSARTTIDIIEKKKITNFAAAPTVYRALRAEGIEISNRHKLRCLSSAGEPLTPEINEWAKSFFGLSVHDHYGQTETSMVINNHHHPELKTKLRDGSMGKVMPGWSAIILKNNEDIPEQPGIPGRVAFIIDKSPFFWFAGYIGNPKKSAEKFSKDKKYYLTGDTGSVDNDGYYYFSTRDDDVIIMAGYRIGPFEVESALITHNAVAECAVIATPDKVRGEVIEAFVVLMPGTKRSDQLTEDLQQWVKSNFAAHAYPRHITFVDELPKTPSGKIQRFILRERRKNEILMDQNNENHY